jgi:hypothetical protein
MIGKTSSGLLESRRGGKTIFQDRLNPNWLGAPSDMQGMIFLTTTGVIVGDDDSRSSVGQRIREDFARMNRTPVNKANRNDANVQDFIRPIDAGT